MTSTGQAVGEDSKMNAIPDDLPTVSQPTPLSTCDSNILAKNISVANIQARGSADVDVSMMSAFLPADYYSVTRNSQPVSSEDAVAVAAAKLLHEKHCSSAMALCLDAVEGAPFLSPAKSAMEALSLCKDAAPASPPSPPARLFSDSENENPYSARIRRDDSVVSLPTPRAPMKPARVRSLNTLFPGGTRRRLNFDFP